MKNEKERFEVLLEEMRHNFKLAFEKFAIMDSKFEAIDRRFDSIDNRFNIVDARFNLLDRKIDRVHSSLKQEINLSNSILSEQIKAHSAQPSHTGIKH